MTYLEYEFHLTALKLGLEPNYENVPRIMKAVVEGEFPEIGKAAMDAFSIKVSPEAWAKLMTDKP